MTHPHDTTPANPAQVTELIEEAKDFTGRMTGQPWACELVERLIDAQPEAAMGAGGQAVTEDARLEMRGPETEAILKRDGYFLVLDWWRFGKHLTARVYEPQMMPISDALADLLALALEGRPELAGPALSQPHPADERVVEALEGKIEAAREFVKRHPDLSEIDLAEFEAFLKIPAALAQEGRNG